MAVNNNRHKDSYGNKVYMQNDSLLPTFVVGTTVIPTLTAQITTTTFNQDIVAAESISVDVDGVTVTQAFDTDNDTTVAALAVKLAAEAGIATAVVTDAGVNDRIITCTAAVAGTAFVIDNVVVTTAAGLTLTVATPTPNVAAVAGYAKSCVFIDSDVATGTGSMYLNKGTTTSAIFSLVTQA